MRSDANGHYFTLPVNIYLEDQSKTAFAANGSILLSSSYEGGDDDASGVDSTSRLNLQSYQRANYHGYGETIRHYLMRKDAKAMEAWYGPAGLYDGSRNAVGTDFDPWVWAGAHYEANDHGSIHGHYEIEVPDSTGALQGRFEVLFANQTSGVIGLDKTFILTNLADFVVRTSNSQSLRLSSAAGNHKPIEFSLDALGGSAYRRWILRTNSTAEAGANAGSDFQIIRYGDDGVLIDQALHIDRATGTVVLGSSTPTAGAKLDINGDAIRLRTAKTPASAGATGSAGMIAWDTNYIYVCTATNTWKRTAIATW